MPAQAVCLIDDFGPVPLYQPQTVSDMADLVYRAAAEEQAVYPLGGQTSLNLGLPPTRPGIGVDVSALTRVIDYPARDMTITVEAGITISRLQEFLKTENQRLPVDVPRGEQATLGGALAVNASGPRRYGFGTLRDYVIGISVINDEGREIKAGGRVVKNVAGYDLCKLYIGSLGTLGIITHVTLKLRPLPEETALIILRCESNRLDDLLDQLHRSRTRPVCLDLLNGPAARSIAHQSGSTLPNSPWILIIGFEDNRVAVGWQVQQCVKELPAQYGQGLDARIGAAAGPLWRALVESPAQPDSRLTFKANMLPSATAAFCQQAESLPEDLSIHAHAGNGIVRGHVSGDLTLERAQDLLHRIRELIPDGGNLVVERCLPAWKTSLPVWGQPRPDQWFMKTIKKTLDPRSLFNPGRFIAGI
jgi:glycolate oxidase FAD binding subunit